MIFFLLLLLWSIKYNLNSLFLDHNKHIETLKCKKSTPFQITLYQSSLKLHKTLNENLEDLTFEQITVLYQMVCTSRQVNFQVCRTNCFKIGLNTTANKFYALNNQFGLGMLNLSFVHFKKLAKIQFMKYGKTWRFNP